MRSQRTARGTSFALALAALVVIAPSPSRGADAPATVKSFRVAAENSTGTPRVRHSWELNDCGGSNYSATSVMIVRYLTTDTINYPQDNKFYPVNGNVEGTGTVVFLGCANSTANPPQGCGGYSTFVDSGVAAGTTYVYAIYPWSCGGPRDTGPGDLQHGNCCAAGVDTSSGSCSGSATNPNYGNNVGDAANPAVRRTVYVPAAGATQDWSYSSTLATMGNASSAIGLGVVIPGGNMFNVFGNTGGQIWGPPQEKAKYIAASTKASWPMVGTLKNGTRIVLGFDTSSNNLYGVNARTGDIIWRFAVGATVTAPPAMRLYQATKSGQDIIYVGTGVNGNTNAVKAIGLSQASNGVWTASQLGSDFTGGAATSLQQVTSIGIDYSTNQLYITSYRTSVGNPSIWCVANLEGAQSRCSGWTVWGRDVGDLAVPAFLGTDPNNATLKTIWTGNVAGDVYQVPYGGGTPTLFANSSRTGGSILTRVWPEWRGTSTKLVYVRNSNGGIRGFSLSDSSGASDIAYVATTAKSGPAVDGTDGYLVWGNSDGTLHRKKLDNTGDTAFTVCPTACNLSEPMFAFPDNGWMRVVIGSDAGYAGRFNASLGSDGDDDHDGVPNASDNCSTVYNPKQNAAACAAPVVLSNLSTTQTSQLQLGWFFSQNGANTDIQCGSLAGSCGASADALQTVTVTFPTDGTANAKAEVSQADDGTLKVAIRNITKPTETTACTQTSHDCSCTCGPYVTLYGVYFSSISFKFDDSTWAYNWDGSGPVTRWTTTAPASTGTGAALGGIAYIDAILRVNMADAHGCNAPYSTYQAFRASPVSLNLQDANGQTGTRGIKVDYNDTAKTLHLRFDLQDDVLMNSHSCMNVNGTLGNICAGIKGLWGDLYFTL